jgi:hypothetical protein
MKSERTPEVVLLVVETATGDAAEERALRQVVNGTLGLDARGRYWHVERLFPPVGAEPSDLDRYFRVSGSIDAPPHLFEQAAFELAYRLSEAGRLRVEPDLPSSSFAPPPAEDFLEAAAGPEHHLPASDSHTWALEAVHCPEAWELPPPEGGASRGEGVIIAHPDTGYTNHRAIDIAAFDLRLDWDILSNDDDATDPLETRGGFPLVNPGHGTSTASVLAGRLLESREGAAPRATIVPLRTIKSVVQVFDSDVARAVDYARRIGTYVVSMNEPWRNRFSRVAGCHRLRRRRWAHRARRRR